MDEEEFHVDFCRYIEDEVKNGRPDLIPRFCPVPKIKGLYTPTQEQVYKRLVGLNCNISKKLPGTLTPGNVSKKMSQLTRLRNMGNRKGCVRFVLNDQQTRFEQGLPGGTIPPIINQF